MDISSIGFAVPSSKTGLSMHLTDFAQFESWLKSELKAWDWLAAEEKKERHWYSSSDRISPFTQISELYEASQASERAKPSDPDSLLDIVAQIKSAIDGSAYIPSRSPLGEFLIAEGALDPKFGLKLLETVLNQQRNYIPSDRQELLAVFALSDFQRGFSKNRLKESIDKSEKIMQNLRTLEKQIVGIKNSNTKDLDDFKKAMKKEIALKEPIDYWNKKAKNHMWATGILALLFIVYSVIALIYLANFIFGYDDGIQGFIASWKDTGIGAVTTFAGLIGIGMVIARVLYRLFASQLHLWNDARERVTMIQTYLALAAEGHAKEEFLGALMQRLFSPSADGIVKAELGAVGPMDALQKAAGKS